MSFPACTRRPRFWPLFLVFIGLATGGSSAVGQPQTDQTPTGFDFRRECDSAAGHPEDVRALSPNGVTWGDLKAEGALVLCQTAHARFPDHGQTMVNLSRVYNKLKMYKESFRLAERAAQTDHPFAYYWLGIHYDYGDGVPKNQRTAHEHYVRGAELGSAASAAAVSRNLRKGKGADTDMDGAISYARKAIALGSVKAYHDLGLALEQSAEPALRTCPMWPAFEDRMALAKTTLERAVEHNQPAQKDVDRVAQKLEKLRSIADVWRSYENGGQTTVADTIPSLTERAETDHLGAQCVLAVHYLNQEDWNRAIPWALRAAKNGQADMQAVAGKAHQEGIVVEKNNILAADWYLGAAEKGYSPAAEELGLMYARREVANDNWPTTKKYILMAANKGHAEAQATMGEIILMGENGEKQDYAEAKRWFDLAAAQGNSLAYFGLSSMYLAGDGVAQDMAEGVRLMRKAADLGHTDAMYMLGYVYAHGEFGVEKNIETAKTWLQRAAGQGSKKAQKLLSTL